jgi:hypothetical protein
MTPASLALANVLLLIFAPCPRMYKLHVAFSGHLPAAVVTLLDYNPCIPTSDLPRRDQLLFSHRSLKLSASLILVAGFSVVLTSCKQKPATNAQPAAQPATQSATTAATAQPKPDFSAVIKSTSPVAYFRLESPSGSSEIGGAGYLSKDGVTTSSSCVPMTGLDNKCARLNGKDGWISTTQAGGVATAGSILAWVNLAALPKDDRHFFYVAGESQSGNDFDLQFENDNTLKFYTSGGAHSTYTPDPNTLVNQWHMIVATMDSVSRTRAIYWDGQLVATDQDSISPNKTSLFSIGNSTVFGGRFFNGSIDEVALWNRSLGANEVAAIYKGTK